MFGQGSPIAWKFFCNRCAFWQIGRGSARLIACSLLLTVGWFTLSLECGAAEKTVRLRLGWVSGTAAKQRWTGEILIVGGVLTQLQPLGIEADAPVALRIDGSRLIVAPLEQRSFDGCDITVRADEQALVRVSLRSDSSAQVAVFEAPLAEVITEQLRGSLDQLGSFFLAHRSPGDQLRVLPTREHWVFGPSETWNLKLQPDLAAALAIGPVLLDVQLRATGEAKPSWQSTQQISAATQLEGGVDFQIVCPATEGAYRLTVTARPEEGFATRFVPGQQAKPIATRDVEFVVIDPAAQLPELVDQWLSVLTIDPANDGWWQRLPAWAQVPGLRERNLGGLGNIRPGLPAWAQVPRLREKIHGAAGNVRPVVRPTPTGALVEIPPATTGNDPYWQSYTLPVREPGEPHLVEIEYPANAEQHLAISVIEPDASGRVTNSHQDASLYSEGLNTAGDNEVSVHRFVFWPRTRAPQLLLVNRHPTAPGQYGKIELFKQDTTLAALTQRQSIDTSERLVAGYLAKPLLPESFGAEEFLDTLSGLSVQSWGTFLKSAQRLAQSLRLGGYNGVLISVAADGSGLYPSRVINPSPRYDTGLLAANGQDPTRKDVLEMLLRIFDREGIRVVPTVQMAAPLPRLEVLRLGGNAQTTGIACVGYNGKSWLATNSSHDGLAPYYNPLNDRVQSELSELVGELISRYGQHPSLAGVAVQVAGTGYGMLPGLAWGLDDSTATEYSQATGAALPGQGAERFRQRAELLLGEQRPAWLQWRTKKLSQLYAKLAEQVTADRNELRLILATEDLFAGPELQQRVRQAIAKPIDFRQILADHGLDLEWLNAQASITALVPHRLSVRDQLQARAVELRVNSAVQQGDLVPNAQRNAELFHHATSHFRLPSFDQRSPFGAEQTYLTVSSQPQEAGASQRRYLVAALANGDAETIVAGGLRLLASTDSKTRGILQTIQELPYQSTETRTQGKQPVVMRVYRANQATDVMLTNEAPWPVQAKLTLNGSKSCDWKKMGVHGQLTNDASLAGTLAGGEQTWQVDLQPYDLQAWRFVDEKLRVGDLKTSLTDLAKQDLQQRIEELESRAGNLNIERPYAQLQNPGFELEDGGVRIVGWQPRQGAAGTIGLDLSAPHSGSRALRLKSENAVGVAVQSHLFPAPDTGQLLVSAYLRVDQFDQGAELRIAVQDQDEGRRYRQVALLGTDQLSRQGWSHYQFALNDVPFGNSEQLRLHFHLTGGAEVLVDDVELHDLRFDDAQRRGIVYRISAAKIALEDEQIVDCLRVVEDYWSRYLVEYVPQTDSAIIRAAKQTPITKQEVDLSGEKALSGKKANEQGIGSRLRSLLPQRWW